MTARPLQSLWRIPEIRFATIITLLLAWCAALLAFRVLWTWKLHYTFLVWNLALAAMPVLFSTLFVHSRHRLLSVGAFTLWLLFFPNAPYLITDFIHLRNHTSAPIWFDILLLFSAASVGLTTAYISLSQIHDRLSALNRPALARAVAITAPFAAGFGIYLGRFLRWRTIDIIQNPLSLISDIAHRFLFPWQHPRAWGVTLTFGTLLALGYFLARISTLRPTQTTMGGRKSLEP
jgi:uncharacterized membrane protein